MNINNLKDLPNSELKKLATECYDILNERKRQKNAELIEKLKEAFYDVQEAGITVSILDHGYCDIELTALPIDDFYFEY